MVVELFQGGTIEYICCGAGSIESQDTNAILTDFPPDIPGFAFGFKIRSTGFCKVVHEFLGHNQILSSQMAAPWPPPTQSETRARCACLLLSSRKLVRMSLAPVAPTG